MQWLKNTARAAIVTIVAAASIALATPAQAYPSFLPPPPPGHEWTSYCGWWVLANKGVWCHWTLVRIP